MVEARPKIAAYIDYRVSRLNELLDSFPSIQTSPVGSTSQAAAAVGYGQLTRQ